MLFGEAKDSKSMAITYIDASAREVKVGDKPKKGRFKLFFKTLVISFASALGILIVVSLVLGVIIYPRAKSVLGRIDSTYGQAQKLETALSETKDLKQAEIELASLKKELIGTKDEYSKLSFLRFVPIAASYYSDGEHLIKAAEVGVDLGDKSLLAFEPFSAILGFKSNEKEVTAEEKAQKIVKDVIPKLIPLVDDIDEGINKIKIEIDKIDSNRYPAGLEIKGVKVKDTLKISKEYLDKAHKFIPETKPILQVAPELAGEPTAKTYLVLLQNDKELRPTGGFITAYALLTIKGGKIVATESDDIYKLDLKYRDTEKSPEAIRKYLNNTLLPIRDSNVSPDYRISAEKFESMYNTIPKMPKVDGVFALDTEFVRSILEVSGPIKTKKTKEVWSAEKNKLGIPDVIYKLELYAEKINKDSNDRKGFVGELMDTLIDTVMGAKPDKMKDYIEAFVDTANRKHILFYFHNSFAQKLVERYNYAGRIKDYDSDYFHLNNSNFGGLKGNLYVQQKVVQDIQIDSEGRVTKSVDVTLINPVKADGWLVSIYLNWMRLYAPKGSTLISKKVFKDFTSGEELNKEVYRGFGPTYPKSSSTTNFTYQLPFKIKPGENYKMLIQKQPGVNEIDMTIKINGVKKEEFKLTTDKELSIKL